MKRVSVGDQIRKTRLLCRRYADNVAGKHVDLGVLVNLGTIVIEEPVAVSIRGEDETSAGNEIGCAGPEGIQAVVGHATLDME